MKPAETKKVHIKQSKLYPASNTLSAHQSLSTMTCRRTIIFLLATTALAAAVPTPLQDLDSSKTSKTDENIPVSSDNSSAAIVRNNKTAECVGSGDGSESPLDVEQENLLCTEKSAYESTSSDAKSSSDSSEEISNGDSAKFSDDEPTKKSGLDRFQGPIEEPPILPSTCYVPISFTIIYTV